MPPFARPRLVIDSRAGVKAVGIIEAFDVPGQITTSSITCRVDLVVDALDFEGVEEALHGCVVEAVAPAARGRGYTCCGKDLAVGLGSVLDPAVAVMKEAGRRALPFDRHPERVDGDVGVQCLAHGPADHLAGRHVDDGGEEELVD